MYVYYHLKETNLWCIPICINFKFLICAVHILNSNFNSNSNRYLNDDDDDDEEDDKEDDKDEEDEEDDKGSSLIRIHLLRYNITTLDYMRWGLP